MKKTDNIRDKMTVNENQEPELRIEEQELEQKIRQMEKEYHAIKIPEELRKRVIQTMQETDCEEKIDQEEKTDNMDKMKKTGNALDRKVSRFLLRTGQTAAAALLLITVLANSGAKTAYAMEQIPVIGAITKVVTFRTYEKQNKNSEAKVEIPKIEAGKDSGISDAADQVNKSVKEYTDQIIARYEEDLKAYGKEVHLGLFTDYKVLMDNSRFFTLKIETDEIMASGYQTVKIYNIDKKNDKILQLKDMFPAGTDYVTLLSDAVKEVMRKNMETEEGKVYFLDSDVGSNFEKIQENQNFYINEAGRMVLVFDEYEVAPGYMGIVEIEIPDSIYHADI